MKNPLHLENPKPPLFEMKDKKLDQVGEFFFDEKTESLHQMAQTGFDSAQWRNLDEEIDKHLDEHFKKFANK